MKQLQLSLLCFFFVLLSANAQDNSARINTIINKLEVLKIETPGLDESLNINVTQTTLANFLLAIANIHEININVSPELSQITVVNNFANVAVVDILIFLVKEYDLDIDFTGSILSVKKYVAPPEKPIEKSIGVNFDPTSGYLSLDLKNEKLDVVFRSIMDQSGKNLLFAPGMEGTPLTIYLRAVPFEMALEKLAEANNLLLSKSDDGFYAFESAYLPTENVPNGGKTAVLPIKKRASNFFYKVLDTLTRRVAVDLKNTPVADVIYTLGAELKLDIFTASPLDNLGTATVEAKDITFDLLLEKIFQSTPNTPANGDGGNKHADSKFTYKHEDSIYYFGTEDQLSLKQVEVIPMMFRSVLLLEDPASNGQRRAGRNNYNTLGYNGNFQNNFGQNQQTNRPNDSGTSASKEKGKSIEEIIPEDLKQGLDIKIDPELNSFVVSGPGIKVERFKDFIQFIDKPVPVILIEVMILEVNRSAITETGISFGIGDKPVTTQGEFFPAGNVTIGATDVNKIIGNFDGFGALNLGKVLPNFYLDIKAMETAGTLRVKSTPKLTTINGHKAYLSSGETTYYAVTSQSFYGSQIPQTSEIKNYVPIDAELSLEILPYVSGNGQITLNIQVLQSAFNGERIADDAPPGITSREFSSIVRMEDQDVVILGGIESIRKEDSGSGVPFLARIPIIKWLFSKKRRESTKRDLNIVIKPIIIE